MSELISVLGMAHPMPMTNMMDIFKLENTERDAYRDHNVRYVCLLSSAVRSTINVTETEDQ